MFAPQFGPAGRKGGFLGVHVGGMLKGSGAAAVSGAGPAGNVTGLSSLYRHNGRGKEAEENTDGGN